MGGLLLKIGEFPMNQGDGILNSLGQLQKLGGESSLYRWGPAQMGLAMVGFSRLQQGRRDLDTRGKRRYHGGKSGHSKAKNLGSPNELDFLRDGSGGIVDAARSMMVDFRPAMAIQPGNG
jgi:hypothetical protein